MRDVFSLFRAYWVGTRPLSLLLGVVKRKVGRFFMFLTMIYGFLVLSFMLGVSYANYQAAGQTVGHAEWGYAIALFLTFFFMFFTCLFSIGPLVTHAKDMPLLMTLPVPSRTVFLSRFLLEWLVGLVMGLFMLAPAAVVMSLPCVSLQPIISVLVMIVFGGGFIVSLDFLVASLALRWFGGNVREGVRKGFFTVAIVVIAIFGTRNMTGSFDGTIDYIVLAKRLAPLMDSIPLFTFLARSNRNLMVLLASVVFFAGSSWVCLSVASRFFVGNYSLAQNSGRSTKRKRNGNLKASNPVSALLKRERVIIKSESVFQMEIYGEVFIPVILLAVYAATGVMGQIASGFESIKGYPKLPAVVFLFFSLFACFGSLSSTSVSREGKLFELDKTYPLASALFVRSKVFLHLAYLGTCSIVYLSVALPISGLSFLNLVWMIPLVLMSAATASCIGLAIDYTRPMLAWTLPQQAVKSNVNVIFSLLASCVYLAFIGLPLILIPALLPSLAVAFAVAVCFLVFSYRLALKCAGKAIKGS